jgi:uncharacterized protein
VVKTGRGVASFDKLLGRKVGIGPAGSNENKLFRQLMAAMGWTVGDFGELAEIPAAESQAAFCADQLDALFYFTGHPSDAIAKVLNECDGSLAPVDSPFIGGLASEFGYMAFGDIRSGELYGKSPEMVRTVGLRLVVVATKQLPAPVAEGITTAILDGLPRLKMLHPSMADLTPASMATDGITVPLHDGAMAAYNAMQVPTAATAVAQ